MSARDELIELRRNIHEALIDPLTSAASADVKSMQMALHLNKEGYRKPRTITTTEELDGLAEGSVIALGTDGEQVNVALKTHADKWGLAGQSRPLDSPTLFRAAVERDGFTLTVLSEPTA